LNVPLPVSALALQVEALLQSVTRDSEQRCTALRVAADSQARQITAAARGEALANVRTAIAQERSRIEQELRQAEASAELEARRHEQRQSQALLTDMWAAIAGVLQTRWRNPMQRRAWLDAALAEAGALLAGRDWSIEHGAGLPDRERGELELLARQHGSGAVEWRLDASAHAGVRIRAERVCIDATVPGLLVQRDEVESWFLAAYLAPDTTSGPGRSVDSHSEHATGD
jgi:vacuolar-type H+-ATPase subunit E/Vma4